MPPSTCFIYLAFYEDLPRSISFYQKTKIRQKKNYPQEFINNLFVDSDFLEFCIETKINSLYKLKKPRTKNEEKSRQYRISKLQTIAFHPNISATGLKKILNFDDRTVRSSAIANQKMPQYITEVWEISFLDTLNQNELKIIASSFYATDELLKELVNHQDIVVSRTAASNPCASDEVLEE